MSTIDKINARMRAMWLDPDCVDTIREFQSVRWSNLHDSSCAGRVCLNPAHMPDGGAAIDVTPETERRRLT